MQHSLKKSAAAFARAKKVLCGGVNSPVRAFRAVGGHPVFFASGKGATLTDVDGNRYLDYVGSWGPLILGHAHPPVLRAIEAAARRGTTFGAPTVAETDLAEAIRHAVPSMERVRLVSSGTEAVMGALRVARAFTRRDFLVKFDGCYHGHADGLLVKAGSGATTLGIPTSPGVPKDYAKLTLTLPYNDLPAARALFNRMGKRIAAVIIEPVAGNMGVVNPAPGFLEGLRALTKKHGALLVFDEVMTGFRIVYGGVQKELGVTPDLTTLAKVVGGGLPLGAYGGRRDVMDLVAPAGPVYQAGTLSGNPLATAAGLAALRDLRRPGVYRTLALRTRALAEGLVTMAHAEGVPACANWRGSMFTLFFAPGPVRNYEDALKADTRMYAAFFHGMLARGCYFPPAQFEAAFVSTRHGVGEVIRTLRSARAVFKGWNV